MNKFRIVLCAMLAVMMCVLCVTANTFSWLSLPKGETSGGKLRLENTLQYNDNNSCEFESFACDMENGDLVNPVALTTTNSYTIKASGAKYFKTKIKNNALLSAMNITLGGMKLSNTSTALVVTCMTPLKTTVTNGNFNVNIAKHIIIPANSELTVEWFIYNKSGSPITTSFTTLPQVLYYE